MSLIKAAVASLKKLFKLCFGGYGIYDIYHCSHIENSDNRQYNTNADTILFCSIAKDDVINSNNKQINEAVWYFGHDAHCYACLVNGVIVSICCYWSGTRYRLTRNFWPLKQHEAKLVHIITISEMRGKKLAQQLIKFSSEAMLKKGFTTLYARIWHSNVPSRRAFENCNWKYLCTKVEIFPLSGKLPIRFQFKRWI